MPRRPGIDLADLSLHIVHRGNNRSACFFCDEDRAANLCWLRRYATRFRLTFHEHVLMTTHVHLLVTPPAHATASRFMPAIGRRYVPGAVDLFRPCPATWLANSRWHGIPRAHAHSTSTRAHAPDKKARTPEPTLATAKNIRVVVAFLIFQIGVRERHRQPTPLAVRCSPK